MTRPPGRVGRAIPAGVRLGAAAVCLLLALAPLPAVADITFDPSEFVPAVALRPLVYSGLVAAACALAAALALLGVLSWRMIVQARRLTASQERLRAFLDRPSDWVWEADGDSRLTYVSPGFTRATGVPVEQVLGLSRAEALAGRVDGRDLLRHARDLRARRPFDDLVAQHVRPDGQRIWIRSSGVPRYDAQGRFVGYIGTSEDITREVEADRRLADFRTMLEHVFAQVPDALMLVDAEGRVVGSNSALCALTGLAPEELLGRKGGDLLKVPGGDKDGEVHHCPFGFPRPGPAMLNRNDGALVPVEMVGSPIRSGDGPAIGAFALIRDRRGTVAAERALAAARDAANALAAGVPVQARFCCSIVLARSAEDEEYHEHSRCWELRIDGTRLQARRWRNHADMVGASQAEELLATGEAWEPIPSSLGDWGPSLAVALAQADHFVQGRCEPA